MYLRRITGGLCLLVCLGAAAAPLNPEGKQRVAVGHLIWAVPGNSWDLISGRQQADELMRGLRSMITTSLTQTRKFEIVERANLDQLVEELKLTHDSGLVDLDDPKSVPEWGRLKGIDWLVIGTVTQFSRDTSAGGISGVGATASEDFLLVVDTRLVDVESGLVKVASPVTVKVNVGMGVVNSDRQGMVNKKGKGQQMNKLMRGAAQELVRHIASNIIPIKVIGLGEDEVVLNYGEGFLEMDDYLVIYRKGVVYVDPDTGEEEAELVAGGRLRVYQVQRSISKAVPIEKTKMKDLEIGGLCMFGAAPKKKQGKVTTFFKKRFGKN